MESKGCSEEMLIAKVQPECPVFGLCGGCHYQDLPYEEELRLKEARFRSLVEESLKLPSEAIAPIVPSPKPYHYRSRLDLHIRKHRDGSFHMGFQAGGTRRLVPVHACPIAMPEISDFLPELKEQAAKKFPPDYRIGNLVVRSSDAGLVRWGGVGRRSLELSSEDYFWTEIHGKKIFYSLDTFFQANLSILPLLMDRIQELAEWDQQTVFFDLYAGVGLFGIYFADQVGRAVLIEENVSSLKLMRHNADYHKASHVEVFTGKVEQEFPRLLALSSEKKKIAMIDPPRKGLSDEARALLAATKKLSGLLYLSCSPETLVRDLQFFIQQGWSVESMTPFDFFPKTNHLEVLSFLRP